MSGALFYNTYSAPGAINLNNGAVMRLPLGQLQSEIYMQWPGPVSYIPGTGPCISCHSISFNGSTIVSSYHDYMNKVFEVSSYPVTPQPQPAPITKLPNAVLGALTPDGTRMLTMGNPDCTAGAETFPRSANNFPLVEGPDYAKVLDVNTGQELTSSGLDRNFYMWMPQFSPNGDMVVFNHAKPNGAGGTDRRELAVMDYDYATNSFSNLRVVVTNLGPAPSLPYAPAPAGAGAVATGWNGCVDTAGPVYYGGDVAALNPGSCTGPCYPAFPFFTPDGRGVVFSLTSEPDFTNAFPGRDYPAKSELYYVDIATMATTPLTNINNALNPADRLADYFPTVLPVGVGGKFWVFWTSRRAVGHRIIGIAGEILPGIPLPANSQLDATKKRIWAAAIDINPLAAGGVLMDPSHPGFYLPGQSDSGNVRAFAALNPCRPTGGECQSGLDCCSGFCNITQGAAAGTCVDEPPAVCSRENERCSTDADCCPAESGPRLECLGGYCGPVEIIIQ
jgi:hypothetical protein